MEASQQGTKMQGRMLLIATAEACVRCQDVVFDKLQSRTPGGVDGIEAAAHQLFAGGEEDEGVSKLNRVCTELHQGGPHLHAKSDGSANRVCI